jgi:hypothetical protein
MQESDRGVDRLNAIALKQVRQYLLHKGWCEERSIGNITTIWELPSTSDRSWQLLLPLKKELPGFAISIQMVLDILAQVEGRSSAEILEELLTCKMGVRVRGTMTHISREADGIAVTIVGVIGDRFGKVWVKFDGKEATSIEQAHQNRSEIGCTGDLVEEEARFLLKNPRDLCLEMN